MPLLLPPVAASEDAVLAMDEATRGSLEITAARDGSRGTSLLGHDRSVPHRRGLATAGGRSCRPLARPGGDRRAGPQRTLALFGELHPRVAEVFDLRGTALAFEVRLDAIPPRKAAGPSRGALAIPELGVVERDLAFVVDARTEAAALLAAAQGADPLVETVRVFDVFEGGGLGEGRKSLALTVRLQPREATLTDEEIAGIVGKVVSSVEKKTGGSLRR